MKEYFVYILSNFNNKVLYIGVTNDIRRRVFDHKEGRGGYFTKKYNVDKLVYCEIHNDINQAIHRETRLKKYRRADKEKLVTNFNPEWQDLYYAL